MVRSHGLQNLCCQKRGRRLVRGGAGQLVPRSRAYYADPVLAIVAKLRATWHRLGKVIEETNLCEGPLFDEVQGVLDAAKAELLETPPTTLAGATAAIAWLVEFDEHSIPETSGEYMRTLSRSPIFAQEEART